MFTKDLHPLLKRRQECHGCDVTESVWRIFLQLRALDAAVTDLLPAADLHEEITLSLSLFLSPLELGDGVFEVKSTDGDTHLGGDDFDHVIVDWLADEFLKEEGIDLRKDPMALQRLKEAAEKAKIELSSTTSTEINLPYIMPVNGIPKHLVKTLTRAKFEQLADGLIKATIEPCRRALKNAGVSTSQIDEVILVGGSTRIPAVQAEVEKFFGKAPSKNVNPDEVVAVGAAIDRKSVV